MRLHIEDPALAEAGRVLAHAVRSAGGRAILVGGSVRDAQLGLPIQDLDFEVFDLSPDRL